MENKKTLGNENAEVQTEEKRNDVEGEVITDSTEQASVVNTDNIEADDEETADGSVAVDLRRKEKAIIITMGVILTLLLIWLIIWAMGATRDYASARTDNGDNTSYSTSDSVGDNADDKNSAYNTDNGNDSSAQGNGSDSDANSPSTSGNNGNSGNNNPAGNDKGENSGNKGDGNGGSNGGNNGGNGGTPIPDTDNSPSGGNQGDNGDNQTPGISGGNNQEDTTPPDTTGGDNTSSGNDDGNGNGGNNGGGNQNDDNKGDDAAPDYTGETKVRISEVNDDTGFVTITIDGTSIMVPLQTTVFNGRVTKSGVAQGKLFGYNSGITVMFFYPQDEGFHTTEVNAYMSRTSDALTVLVDINGDGSKLFIMVNGMKSLF